MKKLAAWLAIPALALTLTACSGSEGEAGPDPDSTTGTQKVVEVTDPQGAVDGYVGAIDDAESTSCKASGDGWVSTGEITNPTAETQDYRVYVSFMKKGETLGLVQVDVPGIEPGQTETWNTKAALDAEDLECVLRVERFAPQN